MTTKYVVLRQIASVRKVVEREITDFAKRGGQFAGGMSSEGFAGGYLQALDDVAGALTHGHPSDHRGYWRAAGQTVTDT